MERVGCAPPVGGKTTPFFFHEWKGKEGGGVRRFDLIQGESVDPFCASDQDDVEEVHEIGGSNNGELGVETRSEVSQ